jgi:UDP-N-acetylmuramate dehydrogenase
MKIRENVPLAPLTTIEVGGPARYFVEATTEHEVREGVRFAESRNLPLFVLGGGSNLVVADSGWPGLALKVAVGGVSSQAESDRMLFDSGAGVNWDNFVAETIARNCAGVECLSGIPGSVGGTPVQNVGAYGQEVAETIESVRAFDLKSSDVVDLGRQTCGFGYRTSIFNTSEQGRYIILRVIFRLAPDGAPSLKYADIKKHFSERENPPPQRDADRSR